MLQIVTEDDLSILCDSRLLPGGDGQDETYSNLSGCIFVRDLEDVESEPFPRRGSPLQQSLANVMPVFSLSTHIEYFICGRCSLQKCPRLPLSSVGNHPVVNRVLLSLLPELSRPDHSSEVLCDQELCCHGHSTDWHMRQLEQHDGAQFCLQFELRETREGDAREILGKRIDCKGT